MPDRHWKINEAAELLGVSADTLRHWERQGKLTSERTEGGHRRYNAAQLAPLVAQRRQISEAAALAELKGERLSERELSDGLPVFDAEQARKDYETWLATHPAFPLGLGELDQALPHKGVHAGWMALLQGKAASGKTALLSQVALNLAHIRNKNVLLVTLEERQDSLLRRLGAQRKGISPAAIDVADALAALPDNLAVVSHLPSPEGYVPLTVARLEAVIHEHNLSRFSDRPLDAVIVDHMGMLEHSRRRSRSNASYEDVYGELAEELFMMAKGCDVFLLTAVQMPKGVPYGQPFELQPRHGYTRALPFFDLVYNLWRPAYDSELPLRRRKRQQNEIQVALAKNRFGMNAEQTFRFDPTSLRIRPQAERPH